MNAATKPWAYLAIGGCTCIAGLVLLVAAVAAANPVGLAVGGVLGGSLAFGLIASCAKEAARRRSLSRDGGVRNARTASGAPILGVARARLGDALANEARVAAAGDFAPVASLVEAQLRRRTALRKRARERATLTRA
jgi:hypothetical protein